jgi:S1-C subfamily serine protease
MTDRRPAMPRLAIKALFFSIWLATAAHSEGPDDSLMIYAVTISEMHAAWGAGIYLGDSKIITAAHVVGRAPHVTISGRELAATILKKGSLETTDLALLSIDERGLPMSLRLRRLMLCQELPWPGEDVVTVSAEGTARSRIMSPAGLPRNVRKFGTVIGDVARTGNSGSGVFDLRKKCLLGIMSRKISQVLTKPGTGKPETRDIAKYFVPASTISAFVADLTLQ